MRSPLVWMSSYAVDADVDPVVTGVRAVYPGEISVAALFGGIQLVNYLCFWASGTVGCGSRNSPVLPGMLVQDTHIVIAMALNIIAVLLVPVSERL